MPPSPSFADDCAAILLVMAGKGPASLDELRVALNWGNHYLNQVLSTLRLKGAVDLRQVRVRGKKVNQYLISEKG